MYSLKSNIHLKQLTMYLYKVVGKEKIESISAYDVRYIIAESVEAAISKYKTLPNLYNEMITATPLCKRDEIIPTIEPIKEKINETN